MQKLTDIERKAEQQKYSLALLIGLITVIISVILVNLDSSSFLNWTVAIGVIGVGVFVEEKIIVRKKTTTSKS